MENQKTIVILGGGVGGRALGGPHRRVFGPAFALPAHDGRPGVRRLRRRRTGPGAALPSPRLAGAAADRAGRRHQQQLAKLAQWMLGLN